MQLCPGPIVLAPGPLSNLLYQCKSSHPTVHCKYSIAAQSNILYQCKSSHPTVHCKYSIASVRVFRPLQVLSACTGALAHGGNDVGNCVGPLVLIYHVFEVRAHALCACSAILLLILSRECCGIRDFQVGSVSEPT